MRRKLTLLFVAIVFSLSCGLAMPKPPQNKPLNKDQVMGLVRDHLGDETGAKVVEQRKIDFEPTDAFLSELRQAGAAEVFLQAVRDAAPTPESPTASGQVPVTSGSPPASTSRRLDIFQISDLLLNGVTSRRVADLVEERGIAFVPTEITLQLLKDVGASPDLLDAVGSTPITTASVSSPEFDQAAKNHAAEVEQDYRGRLKRDPSNVSTRLLLVYALHAEGKYGNNSQILRDGIQLRPDSAVLHYWLAYALTSPTGPVNPSAIAEFREAVRLDPNYVPAHVGLGQVLARTGDQEGALAEYRAAVAVDPDSWVARAALGNTLAARGDLNGAIEQFRKIVGHNPNYEFARLDLAAALLLHNDLDGSIAEYHEALRLAPDDCSAHKGLGLALSRKGDLDGAMAEYREASRLVPSDAVPHANLGILFGRKGDTDGAIREFREATRLDPKSGEGYRLLGGALWAKGEKEAALDEYRQAVSVDPKNVDGHANLSTVLLSHGDVDGALDQGRQAVQLNPNYGLAHHVVADALFRKDDLDGALKEYREAIRLDPKDAGAHFSSGEAIQREVYLWPFSPEAQRAQLAVALEEFQTAMTLAPNNPKFRKAYDDLQVSLGHSPNSESQGQAKDELSRGVDSFRNAQYAQAIDHFKKAIGFDPALDKARLYLATTYFKMYVPGGNSPDNKKIGDQAIAAFEDVLKYDPKNATALSSIAAIYYYEKNFQKAKEIEEELVKVEPNNPEPYYWIGQLDWAMVFPKIQKVRADLGLTTPRDPTKPGILPALPDSARAQLRAENGGLIDDGIKALERAIQLKPNYGEAIAYLNLLYREKADTEENQTDRYADIKKADELAVQASSLIRAQKSR